MRRNLPTSGPAPDAVYQLAAHTIGARLGVADDLQEFRSACGATAVTQRHSMVNAADAEQRDRDPPAGGRSLMPAQPVADRIFLVLQSWLCWR
jgi:hypothetical protein